MQSEQDDVVPISDKYSIELKQLINACISFKPNDRPNANDLLEMALTKIRDNAKYKTAFLDFQLLQAAGRGDFNQVLDLLEDGAHINVVAGTDGEGVLHRAAKSGNEALIPFLLAKERKYQIALTIERHHCTVLQQQGLTLSSTSFLMGELTSIQWTRETGLPFTPQLRVTRAR